MRAADLIVRTLEAHGIERVWCVPGESYLALLDALHDSSRIRTIACRHESGAGFMAVAEAKLTARPAVFMVSRGPGATNGSIAVHVAEQDAVPVLMIIGQVGRAERGRGAFQEVDYGQFFGRIAKGVWEVHDPAQLVEILARALHLAQAGTPGPVVLSLPEDVMEQETGPARVGPFPVHVPTPAPGDVAEVARRLSWSRQPLIVAGAMVRRDAGVAALAEVAERHRVPVAVTWKNQDLFDNASPLYAGHLGFGNPPAHREILAEADLILAVGTRLGDIASQNYTLPQAPEPAQPLIHVYPDGGAIGRIYRTEIGIACHTGRFLEALAAAPAEPQPGRAPWIERLGGFLASYMAFRPRGGGDGVDFGEVVAALAQAAPGDAVITTDAGNFSSWVHRHWKLTPRNRLLGAIGGAMGFGVPAGVAASLIEPQRQVIVVVGDGGMLMTGNELATALAIGAKPKIFISNNGTYGTIRQHQERAFPGRVVATDLKNPDFFAWAESFGAKALRIRRGDDIAGVVRAALAHDGAVVVDVQSSIEALSAFTTLSALRQPAPAR